MPFNFLLHWPLFLLNHVAVTLPAIGYTSAIDAPVKNRSAMAPRNSQPGTRSITLKMPAATAPTAIKVEGAMKSANPAKLVWEMRRVVKAGGDDENKQTNQFFSMKTEFFE